MKLENHFSEYRRHLSAPGISPLLEDFANRIRQTREQGGKILLAGNGASASISSHLAVDFSSQAGVRAMAFNDANLITAFANDCGYENWIVKALKIYADPKDLLILISSSGRSANVILGGQYAKKFGIPVVSFTGFDKDNPLGTLADLNFWVDSRSYNIVECVHMIWLTSACDLLIGRSDYSVKP
jgi:D-sedoheptulose 7-phosphate isomerase